MGCIRQYAAFWTGFRPEMLYAQDVFAFSVFPTVFLACIMVLIVCSLKAMFVY